MASLPRSDTGNSAGSLPIFDEDRAVSHRGVSWEFHRNFSASCDTAICESRATRCPRQLLTSFNDAGARPEFQSHALDSELRRLEFTGTHLLRTCF